MGESAGAREVRTDEQPKIDTVEGAKKVQHMKRIPEEQESWTQEVEGQTTRKRSRSKRASCQRGGKSTGEGRTGSTSR